MKKYLIAITVLTIAGIAFAQGYSNFMSSDLYIPAPFKLIFGENSSDDAVLSGASDKITLASGDTLAVTSADKLTVGGVIVPQTIVAKYEDGAAGNATDRVFFLADAAYQITACSEIHSVAAGGASVIQVTKETTTGAPGSGADLLTNNTNTGFDLNATANTLQAGTLTATGADLVLAAGDRLSVDYAQAIQSSAGVRITCTLKRV
jgi:hypothetical protein